MDVIDRDTIVRLARHTGWPAVSLYMPTHRIPTETVEDGIRLKNLVDDATDELIRKGTRQPDAHALMKPVNDLRNDAGFWKNLGDGLAIFVSQGGMELFRTDVAFEPRFRVGRRFLVRPLLSSMHDGERFYVLALSKGRVRLLEGTRGEVHELPLQDMPTSLAEALRYDEFETHLQFHTRMPQAVTGRGQRMGAFHGHGGAPDAENDNLLRYFQAVDRGIRELLAGDTAPLVLAGVDYLFPIYREANDYPHLVEETVSGNPDDLSPAELHSQAAKALEPYFGQTLEADRTEYANLQGSNLVSSDAAGIVKAAHEGRVKTLFVPERDGRWGSYDQETATVEIHAERMPEDWDLTDLAVAQTVMNGGRVHLAPANGDEMAAVLRY